MNSGAKHVEGLEGYECDLLPLSPCPECWDCREHCGMRTGCCGDVNEISVRAWQNFTPVLILGALIAHVVSHHPQKGEKEVVNLRAPSCYLSSASRSVRAGRAAGTAAPHLSVNVLPKTNSEIVPQTGRVEQACPKHSAVQHQFSGVLWLVWEEMEQKQK